MVVKVVFESKDACDTLFFFKIRLDGVLTKNKER